MADNSMQLVKAEDEPQVSPRVSPMNPRKRKPPRTPRTQTRIRQCRFCGHWMEQSNLMAHLAALHGIEGRNEAERMLLAKEKKTRCDVEGCGYIAHSESDYRMHLRETHLFMIEKKNRRLKCPSCEKLFNTQEDLVNHCRVAHGDRDCTIQTCTFQSKEECEMWKESIARTHCTAWQTSGTSQRPHLNNDHVVYYRCSRVPSNLYRIRWELKKTRTLMMVQYCTSFLKEIHSPDGTVIVRYCLKHINHDLDYAFLPLSKTEKSVIANYCRQSHDAEVIQNMIRQEYTDPKTKLHWVATSEIRKVLSSLASSKRNKVKEVVGTSTAESIKEEGHDSMNHGHEGDSVFASALLQSPPDKEDGFECGAISDEAVSARSPDLGIQAESLLGCSSCAKLSERVAELEAIVKRLNSRVIELEDAQLFNGIVKTERNSSQAVDNEVKQENC